MKTLRPRRAASLIESLETRTLLATLVVTSPWDEGEAGTLRVIVAAAAPGDTIEFGDLEGSINLLSPITRTSGDLTIVGPGRDKLTINAAATSNAFDFGDVANVSISGLTIQGGRNGGQKGGGIFRDGSGTSVYGHMTLTDVDITAGFVGEAGGGLYFNYGELTAIRCNIYENTVRSHEASGGGIAVVNAAVTLESCTVSFNTVTSYTPSLPADGGGIYASNSTLNLSNTTVAANTLRRDRTGFDGDEPLPLRGAGVYMDGGTIRHSTLAGNVAEVLSNDPDLGYGGLYVADGGTAVAVTNSIIAGNVGTLAADVRLPATNVTFSRSVVGILGGTHAALADHDRHGNRVGSVASPLDPMLDKLSNNGGTTGTFALHRGSPAINLGSVTSTTVDQRGVARDSAPDAGAYEFVPELPLFTRFPRFSTTSITAGSLSAAATHSEDGLTYQWKRLSKPANAMDPIVAAPASAATGITFGKSGEYQFRLIVSNTYGESISRKLTFTVDAVASSIRIVQREQTLSSKQTTRMRAYLADQFGGRMPTTPKVAWSLLQGSGRVTSGTGVYRPDASVKSSRLRFRATADEFTTTAVNYIRG